MLERACPCGEVTGVGEESLPEPEASRCWDVESSWTDFRFEARVWIMYLGSDDEDGNESDDACVNSSSSRFGARAGGERDGEFEDEVVDNEDPFSFLLLSALIDLGVGGLGVAGDG